MDADTVVVGHADEQGQPTVELWAHRHHDRVAAFGNGGLALGLAAAVVEVDPVRFKGITEIGPRDEHSALTAADAEATDGIVGRFAMRFRWSSIMAFCFSSDTYKLVPIPINATVRRCDTATVALSSSCIFCFFLPSVLLQAPPIRPHAIAG